MTFVSLSAIRDRVNHAEFLKFDERDPCYTWLFPLRLGPLDPLKTWQCTEVPSVSDHLTLYVHVPYCRFICSMCPFTHEPLGKKDLSQYVAAVVEEIRFYARHPRSSGRPVPTLYFGGGTASSLTPDQVNLILSEIRAGFSLTPQCEITLECHPRTVERCYLERVRDAGINRVSFGIQSFDQRYINSLNLHQRVDQSREVIETALTVGFRTVAFDLMYRYPGQTLSDLESDIETAIQIGAQGLSVYALDASIRQLDSVAEEQPSVQIEGEMYYFIHDRLHDAGYVHVAQPDYGLPGHENLQLRDLWGAPQAENLGFGAGAFSESFNGCTWANVHDSNAYIDSVSRGEIPVLMGQVHSWDDGVARYPALGVRCLRVPLEPFRATFGVDLRDIYTFELADLQQRGLLDVADDSLVVTRKGKFFIDNISKAFFNPANRGKTQLWGTDLTRLRPEVIRHRSEALRLLA